MVKTSPVRLFHVSDLHFGAEDAAALAWFAGTVETERPDAVIVTGDLTMRARAGEWAAAEAWLGRLPVPVSVEPGNHDLPYFNPVRRLLRPYGRHARLVAAIGKPLNLPGVWLVPLRTTARFQWRLNWSRGVVGRGSLAEALAKLRACPPGHLAIVACHHPLGDSIGRSAAKRTRGGGEALAALARAGAGAVLSGHVHDPFDMVSQAGPRLIGAGTLSQRVRRTPPSFNALTIVDGRLEVDVRTMPSAPPGSFSP